ncbi:hypothetical protein BO82DRAFT_354034 [Aspergillus uvarum CBS 121591]|uniref:Uncharacterized protein n=1 Tax=Aspergillus uvarum CBS 121591 TaxID=1448315 RepID=A0A319CCZ5_9EURO|nr:hypothetical protein BO82DRAFT_354034 [Aspergillus uvarum CBS 121591]PYH82169.1 hypothetical protein BO82DRAFT_354034 [Aspergillus uvarum CBS 121591]
MSLACAVDTRTFFLGKLPGSGPSLAPFLIRRGRLLSQAGKPTANWIHIKPHRHDPLMVVYGALDLLADRY